MIFFEWNKNPYVFKNEAEYQDIVFDCCGVVFRAVLLHADGVNAEQGGCRLPAFCLSSISWWVMDLQSRLQCAWPVTAAPTLYDKSVGWMGQFLNISIELALFICFKVSILYKSNTFSSDENTVYQRLKNSWLSDFCDNIL